MRYELNDYEWDVIQPMLPNKPRGVPRVEDRRVLNGATSSRIDRPRPRDMLSSNK
jgi:transposase